MDTTNPSLHRATRRTIFIYLGILLVVVLGLGILHYFLAAVKIGGVYWFNLDKERNLSTWFAGLVFFLFGLAAMVAYYWEKKRNAEEPDCFRQPILWTGVGLVGWAMSLDEITILHENLFWREIRQATAPLNDALKYATQWQILFAPAIIVVLIYLVLFFLNRFNASKSARRYGFTGIGCWILALLLEGLRGAFKLQGARWYTTEVLMEEILENLGAIFLLAAILFYIIDIALDFSQERQKRLKLASRFLTRQAVSVLAIVFMVMGLLGGTIYYFAHQQATTGAPLPRLIKKAIGSSERAEPRPTRVDPATTKRPHPKIWFDEIEAPIIPGKAEVEFLMHLITSNLLETKNKTTPIPAALDADKAPRIVFISISDGQTPAQVAIGTGQGLLAAMDQAQSRFRALPKGVPDPFWIKLDIVNRVTPLAFKTPAAPLPMEPSLEGIAYQRALGIALLPEEIIAHTLINSKRILQPANISRYTRGAIPSPSSPQDKGLPEAQPMYRFTTMSYFFDGSEVTRLYRGHRLYTHLSKEQILTAARDGGAYLVRAVNADGKFIYSYRPKTDTVRDKYNILRHAGTLYALLELYELTDQPELLAAARRGLKYLLHAVKPTTIAQEPVACIVENGYVKLGGNALAAIALAKYTALTQDRQYFSELRRLGRWIQLVQEANGRFAIHKQTYPQGEREDFVSQYYPGEALLALTRIHALDPTGTWLDTAAKGARYLIQVRDRGLPDPQLNHDHWLLYALNELHRLRSDPIYLEHALRIARVIRQSQNRNPRYDDWRGSYYRPPRSTPTATRSEGLYAAYLLARDFDHPREAEQILKSLQSGIRFQLQTQFRPETVMYLKDPPRCLGGFHRSLTNFEIRIDYVQHNISSLLGLYRIMNSS